MLSIGNCGFVPNRLYAGHLLNPLHRDLVLTTHLKAIALCSARVLIVLAVSTNIYPLSVRGLIHLDLVFFVPVVQPSNPPPGLTNPQPPTRHQNRLPTPVWVDQLSFFLSGFTPSMAELLVSGFTFGFPIHYEGDTNLVSALQNPEVVDLKTKKELVSGRWAGPFAVPPFSTFRVSPLGVVPKKTPGDFRLIHHLSHPAGSSVNNSIHADFSSVHYSTITDAIRHIRAVGVGCFLCKTDIKNAFRIVPVHPNDYNLLGMKWCDKYYFDKCMPMGCSSSCRTFEIFSSALEWVAQTKLNINHIIHILDDFLIIAPSHEICHRQLNLFVDFCTNVGVPIAPEKTCGPATTLSFAGIELDTLRSEARLPADKILKCKDLISDFLTRKKVSLREVQSLTGLLNFACSVIQPGRAFLRRLIDLTISIWLPYHFICLKREVKADLQVWLEFLEEYNGKSFSLEDVCYTSERLNLYTDASLGSLGFGAIFQNHWCYGSSAHS